MKVGYKINYIMKLFDYLFYRVYSFYKRKRDKNPDWMGALVISLSLFLTLLSIVTLSTTVSNIEINNNVKPLALLLMIVIFVPIWIRYSKEDFIQGLVTFYKDEEVSIKRLRGWLFISYLILVLLIPISIGYMRHNLGMEI